MSYILDALRKSDQQRQRGSSPTLLTAHAAPETSGRFSYIVYGVLAAILLIAGIGIGWFHPWQQEPPAPAPIAVAPPPLSAPIEIKPREVATVHAPAEPPKNAEAELPPHKAAPAVHPVAPPPAPASAQLAATPSAITSAVTPAAAPPRSATKAETKGLVPATVVTAPLTAIAATPPAAPAAQQLANANPAPAPAPPPTVAEQPIIPFAELPFQIRQEIPRLSVAFHAYSKEPRNRLVNIDNRLLHEGDEAAPGLKLEQITSDGMVFDYKGYRFRRSVQDVVNNR
jgi:general secretion pathway protein B